MQKLILHIVLHLYVYKEGKFRIFLQNLHFSANSIKTCNYIRLFNIFWLVTNRALKKFRRPEKKLFWGGFIFSDLIYECVNKKNDSSHFRLILSVYEAFNAHGTFSLIFWLFINSPLKKFGRTENKFFMRWTYFSWIDIHLC